MPTGHEKGSGGVIYLIGGASCAGKTCLAQRLLEREHIPYLSLDHLKMGLVRGWPDCGFTALSRDDEISGKLWPVVRGIIETNLENGQHLIMEGCYLPQNEVRALTDQYPAEIRALYLVLSEHYLQRHFTGGVLAHRCDLERRITGEERSVAEIVQENQAQRSLCGQFGLPVLEIAEDYERELQAALPGLMRE